MPAETEQAYRIATVVDDRGLPAETASVKPAHAEQLVFTLQGSVDTERHAQAWQALIDRHPVLRTGFHSFDLAVPETCSPGSCPLSFHHEDWRDEPDENMRAARFEELLATERATGFDPAVPPLLRVAMTQWQDDSWRVAVTFADRLLDWRALSMLLREWLQSISATGNPGVTAGPGFDTHYADKQSAIVTDIAFWRDYLAGYSVSNAFELLADDAGEGAGKSAGGDLVQAEHRMDSATSEYIRQLRKYSDVTLNNVTQAAWSVLLSRYSGSSDVLFGIRRSCRRSAPLSSADAVGCFTNVIPFRVQFSEDDTVLELLRQVRDQHRKVRDHECTNMDRLRVQLHESGQELDFETVLDFDLRDPVAALAELFSGTGANDFRHYSCPEHKVLLQVYAEEEIVLRLRCGATVMSDSAAQRLLQQYARLLAAIAKDPQRTVHELELLDAAESVAVCWPGAKRMSHSGNAHSLHGGFEDRVRANPDAVAVSCDNKSLTYAELNAAANRLAHRLREQGARPDMLIGLCVERSLEQIIGILGILKSGAGYLPLDPAYPDQRLAFLVSDADVKMVVADENGRERLVDNEGLDIIAPRISVDAQPAENPAPVGDAENLAYVIYTSGSTGQPKGVMVTHHNVMRLFDACASWLQPGIGDVWTMFHSFAFDFSVWEIWGALLHGGRLEVVPRNIARSPDAFHQLLVERGVTVLNQTPSAFQQLMRVNAEQKQSLPALRFVIFGGEKLDLGSLRDWMRRHGDESPQLVNMYGITETTVHVTYRPITERDVEEASSALIGWPLPDLYVRLLDERRRPVPPGTRGEICVGGAGVTRGYLNREDLNAQKFIQDPWSENPNARLYCSGDFARLTASGELVYLGRDDDQVKIRGFRIDLGEISNTLQSIEGVCSAVVVPREAAAGKRLVAYYVETHSGRMPEAKLREALARLLPEHMVPAILVRLDGIPVNANNKIDFKALPDPADVASDTVEEKAAPVTHIEQELAEIWADVLERRNVARTDDFFGLGGDSVLALQVIARARAAGMDISPRDLFENSRLSTLAAVVEAGLDGEIDSDAAVLTPGQYSFFARNPERPQRFNHAHLFRLAAGTDIDLLEQACLHVVKNHEALRSRYGCDEHGEPLLDTVEPQEALEFSRIELDHLDAEECQEATALITADIQRSLSITSGLLMRVAYFSGGTETGDRLMIAIHKLAADAHSWKTILSDIDTAYQSLAAGNGPALPAVATPVRQWAGWLAQHARLFEPEISHWQQLAAHASAISSDATRTGREAGVSVRHVTLPAGADSILDRTLHEAYGTDAECLLIAAFAAAYARQWPDSKPFRIDVEHQGRDMPVGNMNLARTVGWLSYRYPLLLDSVAASEPSRLIRYVKESLRSTPNNGIGWSLLQQHRDEMRGMDNSPILFRWLGEFQQQLNTPIMQHVKEESADAHARERHLLDPLTITADVVEGRLRIKFLSDPAVIPDSHVEAIATGMTDSLQEIIEHARSAEHALRTPADFPFANLAQHELDDFPVDLRGVEDILPLTPIQRLYHTFSGTEHDVGFDQWVFRLRGHIDEAVFETAWRELLQRHDALRTVFVDQGLAEPQQVVLREVPFRIQRSDWRLLDDATQQRRLDEFLAVDRAEGFQMDVAPLTRVTLFRARDMEWILVWSHHMAQVDGWSWPILADELGELHDARLAGREPALETPGRYRRYIEWLAQRDGSEYAEFWRKHFDNTASTTGRSLITRSRRQSDGMRGKRDSARETVVLPEVLGTAIGKLARRLRLTPSTIFQAGWALLLASRSGRFDVTLGVAFSGRTAGIPLNGPTIGPFVNDLPVNVRVMPEARVEQWLAQQRSLQNDINHYQNVSPREIHEWTGTPPGRRLFDTLLVFQNYATGAAAERWGEHIRVQRFEPGVVTNYPLALAVTPGSRYRLDFVYETAAIDADAVAALARDLQRVLDVLANTPEVRISTVLNHLAGESGGAFRAHSENDQDGKWGRRAGDGQQKPVAGHAPLKGDIGNDDKRQAVAAICREVLGIESLDFDRNFFDAGAQSVSLIEIHDRLQKTLGRTFPIVKLFQHPTIAALGRYLQQGEAQATGTANVSRRAAQRRAAQQQRRQPRQPGRFDQP